MFLYLWANSFGHQKLYCRTCFLPHRLSGDPEFITMPRIFIPSNNYLFCKGNFHDFHCSNLTKSIYGRGESLSKTANIRLVFRSHVMYLLSPFCSVAVWETLYLIRKRA